MWGLSNVKMYTNFSTIKMMNKIICTKNKLLLDDVNPSWTPCIAYQYIPHTNHLDFNHQVHHVMKERYRERKCVLWANLFYSIMIWKENSNSSAVTQRWAKKTTKSTIVSQNIFPNSFVFKISKKSFQKCFVDCSLFSAK